MARRDDRKYREYLREEQRSQPGCPAREVVLIRAVCLRAARVPGPDGIFMPCGQPLIRQGAWSSRRQSGNAPVSRRARSSKSSRTSPAFAPISGVFEGGATQPAGMPRPRGGLDQSGVPASGTGTGPGWYIHAMRTTIDKAGRVVIPAAIRERARLTPGAELEIVEDETGIRLERVASGPKLVRVGRRLVARPTVPADQRPTLVLATVIEQQRHRWP